MAQDSEGFRVFENVNSGFVFESFSYLDVGAAQAILVVASDSDASDCLLSRTYETASTIL